MKTRYCISNFFVTKTFPSNFYLRKLIENFMKTKYCISNYLSDIIRNKFG